MVDGVEIFRTCGLITIQDFDVASDTTRTCKWSKVGDTLRSARCGRSYR